MSTTRIVQTMDSYPRVPNLPNQNSHEKIAYLIQFELRCPSVIEDDDEIVEWGRGTLAWPF